MGKWISVDDELPKPFHRVLVVYKYELLNKYRMPMHKGKRRLEVSSAYMDKNSKFYLFDIDESMYNSMNILYWMPYPKPPEE